MNCFAEKTSSTEYLKEKTIKKLFIITNATLLYNMKEVWYPYRSGYHLQWLTQERPIVTVSVLLINQQLKHKNKGHWGGIMIYYNRLRWIVSEINNLNDRQVVTWKTDNFPHPDGLTRINENNMVIFQHGNWE